MKVDEISRWATSAVITFLLVVGGLFADYAFRSGLDTTEGLSALAVAIILFIGVGYSALNFRRLCEAIHKRDIMKKRLQKIKMSLLMYTKPKCSGNLLNCLQTIN